MHTKKSVFNSKSNKYYKSPFNKIMNTSPNKRNMSKLILQIATPIVLLVLIISTVIVIIASNKENVNHLPTDAIYGNSHNDAYSEKIELDSFSSSDKHSVSMVFYDKPDISCLTNDTTLGSLVEVLGISLNSNEKFEYNLDENITEDKTYNVDNVSYGSENIIEYIDYDTEYVEVETIPYGTTEVYQAGESGTKTIEYTITYVNGNEVSREVTNEYISSYPINAIVYKGVGGTISVNGERRSYSQCLRGCKSTVYTVYSGQGYTASGLPADESVIAVDPNVIPLGTYVYIDGIGVRIAADTGLAIKGNFIDIYFNVDNPLFSNYGVQYRDVYILN